MPGDIDGIRYSVTNSRIPRRDAGDTSPDWLLPRAASTEAWNNIARTRTKGERTFVLIFQLVDTHGSPASSFSLDFPLPPLHRLGVISNSREGCGKRDERAGNEESSTPRRFRMREFRQVTLGKFTYIQGEGAWRGDRNKFERRMFSNQRSEIFIHCNLFTYFLIYFFLTTFTRVTSDFSFEYKSYHYANVKYLDNSIS